jgi:hypothetical protein
VNRPAQGNLENAVQLAELDVARYFNATPDRRVDLLQDNFDLVDQSRVLFHA